MLTDITCINDTNIIIFGPQNELLKRDEISPLNSLLTVINPPQN